MNETLTGELSPENEGLLDDICKYVATSKIPEDIDGNRIEPWDGSVLKDFMWPKKGFEEEFQALFLNDKPVKYTTFKKMNLDGISPDTAGKIFILSAGFYKRTPTEHLKKYIKYCDEIKFTPKSFEKHQSTIEELRKVEETDIAQATGENEPPTSSLQDFLTIDNEIDSIKQELKFYPQCKDHGDPIDINQCGVALKKVNKLLIHSPKHIDLLVLKVSLLLHSKNENEAMILSRKLYEENKENVSVVTAYSVVLHKSKDTIKALEIAIEGQKLDPNSVILLCWIANYHYALGNYELAIKESTRAQDLDPDYLLTYFQLAKYYKQTNQADKLVTVWKTAFQIASDNKYVRLGLITSLASQGKKEEAFQYYSTLSGKKDKDYESGYLMALKELSKENSTGAIAILMNNLKSNFFSTEDSKGHTHWYMGLIYLYAYEHESDNSKFLDYAIGCYEDVLKLIPRNFAANVGLAGCYYLKDDHERAKEHLDEASELNTDSADKKDFSWEMYSAVSYLARMKSADYILPLQWSAEKNKNCINSNIELAKAYISSDDQENSKTHADKALEISKTIASDIKSPMEIANKYYDLAELLVLFEEHWPEQSRYREDAIKLLEQCTEESIQKSNFSLWTKAMSKLASCHSKKGVTDKDTIQLDQAIKMYEKLLKEFPRYRCKEEWIEFTHQIAYSYRLISEIDLNIKHPRTYVKLWKEILQEITIESDRDRWLYTILGIAQGLKTICEIEFNDKNLEDSIEFFRFLLKVFNKDSDTDNWIRTHFELGKALRSLYTISNDLENLKDAKHSYCEIANMAEDLWQQEAWSAIGEISDSIATETNSADELLEAISIFKSSIRKINKVKSQANWSYCQYELGYAYQRLGFFRSDCQAFLSSIQAFNDSIESSQNNEGDLGYLSVADVFHYRGVSFMSLYRREKNPQPEHLSSAVESFKKSLGLITINDNPWDFSSTHNCLGDAYFLIAKDQKHVDSLELARHAFQQSQLINTKKDEPEMWDSLQAKIDEVSFEIEKHRKQ